MIQKGTRLSRSILVQSKAIDTELITFSDAAHSRR